MKCTISTAPAAAPEATARPLDLIGALYRVEQEIRDRRLEPEQVQKLRSEKSRPVGGGYWGASSSVSASAW